ncbi:MAG: hypothetical protein HRU19_12580 [Pseudobacteriovorax sp.]|nr:hypothetical protein [Pseudobacteriovorax sp.]
MKQSPAFDAHLKLETSVKIRDLQHYCRSLALKNSNSRQSCTYYMDMNAITPELREEFKYQMKIGSLVPICRIVYRKEGSDTIKCDELEKMQNSFPRKNISD